MYRVLSLILLLLPSAVQAIYMEQGAFTAQTSSGSQTITMRGSFTPQCALIWWTIHSSTGFAASASLSYAVGEFGSGEYEAGNWSLDAAAASEVSSHKDDDQMQVYQDATLQGGFDFGTASAGSFTISWGSSTNIPDSAYRMFYLVVGGVTDCGCGGWSPGNNATDGSYSVNVGAQPDVLFTFTSTYPYSTGESIDQVQAQEALCFGAASDTTKQWCIGGYGPDNQATMNNMRAFYNDRCLMGPASVTLASSAFMIFGAFEANGWRWTYDRDNLGPGDWSMGYMWIKGGNWLVGSTTTPTTASQQTITTTFQPAGIVLGTSVQTSTAAWADDFMQAVGGGSDSVGNEGCIFESDDDNIADADANTNVSTTKVMAADDAHDGTMSLQADIYQFGATSAVLDWTSVLGSGQYYGYIIGGPPTTSTARSQVMRTLIME